jgi:hypothetical protein
LTVKSPNIYSFPWSLGVDHNRVQVVNTLLRIREVAGSNVGPETSCPDWGVSLLSLVPQANTGIVPWS